jgi:hypothetical protein
MSKIEKSSYSETWHKFTRYYANKKYCDNKNNQKNIDPANELIDPKKNYTFMKSNKFEIINITNTKRINSYTAYYCRKNNINYGEKRVKSNNSFEEKDMLVYKKEDKSQTKDDVNIKFFQI